MLPEHYCHGSERYAESEEPSTSKRKGYSRRQRLPEAGSGAMRAEVTMRGMAAAARG